jgi:hypothetical protein
MPVVKCVTSCPVFRAVVCGKFSPCCHSLLSLSCRDSFFAGNAQYNGAVLLLLNHLLSVWIMGVDLGFTAADKVLSRVSRICHFGVHWGSLAFLWFS